MNTQIKEDYVSFEVAKLLKEKGFDSDSKAYYIMYADGTHKFYISQAYPLGFDYNNNEEFEVSAPTHQMAMKWLREVHNIHIYTFYANGWTFVISDLETGEEFTRRKDYSSEEAVEAAIKYCLENLI